MSGKNITTNITAIAAASGVSTATVSRVLNRSPKVASKTAALVLEAVERLGYDSEAPQRGRPRLTSTGLRRHSIALLFPDVHAEAMSTPLSGRLARGAEEVLSEAGVSLFLSHLRTGERLPVCVADEGVDGVIVRSGNLSESISSRLLRLPMVWAFAHEEVKPTHDVAQPDNALIGQLAFQYLTDCGCVSLAVVNTGLGHLAFRQRTVGFLAAARGAGVDVKFYEKNDEINVKNLSENGFDGIFVPGAEKEISNVYRALTGCGRKPVDEVRLIGCANDEQQLQLLDPRLDNIDIQAVEVGRAAAELLLWRLKSPNRPVRRVLVAPKLNLNS